MPRKKYMPSVSEFKVILHDRSMRATSQRLVVHEAMLELIHASVDEVYAKILSKGYNDISEASIYNILSELSAIGIYGRRMGLGGKMVFDVNSSAHLHLYDTFNNVYMDIHDEELNSLINDHLKKRKFKGFKVDGIDININCHPSLRKRQFKK